MTIINGVLEVEGRVPVTEEKKHIIIVHKELEMTEEEIDKRHQRLIPVLMIHDSHAERKRADIRQQHILHGFQ